jgi:hypothetical protein
MSMKLAGDFYSKPEGLANECGAQRLFLPRDYQRKILIWIFFSLGYLPFFQHKLKKFNRKITTIKTKMKSMKTK